MKTIYLVRHGVTAWNLEKRCMGRTDVPLSDKGREQAQALRREMTGIEVDVCYCSPLLRAKETAEIICADKSVEIIPDERLMERDCGVAQGKIVTDWSLYEDDATAENEESMMARANEFVGILRDELREHVLVVSHSGPIKHIRHLLVEPKEEFSYTKWLIGNCEICKIELD